MSSNREMFIARNLLLTVVLCQLPSSVCGITKKEVYFTNLGIYSYRHFGSLQTIHFEVPEDSISFLWNVSVNKTRPACEDQNILLYLQHGSFPIDLHDGKYTFPPTYRIERTSLLKTNTTTSESIRLDRPLYGQWFLGAMMEHNQNQVVKKLSSMWCSYGIVGNVTYSIGDVESLIAGKKMEINVTKSSSYYKFMTGTNVYKYTVILESKVLASNISIATASGQLPSEVGGPSNRSLICDSVPCKMEFDVYYPLAEKWQYLHLHNLHWETPISLELTILLSECTTGKLTNLSSTPTCYLTPPLVTTSTPDSVFSSTFGFNFDEPESLLVPRPFVSMTTFEVDGFKDVGGTLSVQFSLLPIDENYFKERETCDIVVCLQRGRPTVDSSGQANCTNEDNILRLNATSVFATIHIPYPEPGLYFIGHQNIGQHNNVTLSDKSIGTSLGLFVKVKVSSCEDSKCKNGGSCRSSMKGPFVMSYCYCMAGSRGFTCADESRMVSRGLQLLYTLLLCLSNLAFIPAIVVSFRRWRYMECTVYTINMICSTFYHACDMSFWSVYGLCFINYGVYQFSDFFLSLLSFWFTLLAMSRLKSGHILTVLIFGIIVVAILVQSNAVGLLTNILPISVGCLIVIVTWGWKSYKSKSLYPSKKDYMWVVPGVTLAAVGLIVFAFVENDSNYPYTHSFWHLCVAFCIPLLLPRDRTFWKLNEMSEELCLDVAGSQLTLEEGDEDVLVLSDSVQL